MRLLILLFTFFALGCSQLTVVTIVDPFWLAIVGPENGKNLVANAAFQERVNPIILTPEANLQPTVLIEQIKALETPFQGFVLSPIHSGQLYALLRLEFPDLPIAIPLGPQSLAQGRTAVIQIDRSQSFEKAAIQAAQALQQRKGQVLAVTYLATPIHEREWRSFEKAWKSLAQPELTLEVLSFTPQESTQNILQKVQQRLNQNDLLAIFFLTGSLTQKILSSIVQLPSDFGVEGIQLESYLTAKPLFYIQTDWKGIYQRAFESIIKQESGQQFFFQNY